MAVVAWGGAVGRVVRTTPGYGKVRLLTDPNSGVAGIVQRSRAEGMVMGRGVELLEMAYVPHYADVLVGDRVVTSGLDGVFPKGFGIGTVVEVGDAVGASKSIRVRPDVAFAALEEVLVLLEPRGSEILEMGAEEEVR
jgi:rod shape-determining protein MreC